jgi:hypothetical protein
MTEIQNDTFNIEPLVSEIKNVISKGLQTYLKNYIDRYELLEKTHKQIMNLPSVVNELNDNREIYTISDTESDIDTVTESDLDSKQETISDEESISEIKTRYIRSTSGYVEV